MSAKLAKSFLILLSVGLTLELDNEGNNETAVDDNQSEDVSPLEILMKRLMNGMPESARLETSRVLDQHKKAEQVMDQIVANHHKDMIDRIDDFQKSVFDLFNPFHIDFENKNETSEELTQAANRSDNEIVKESKWELIPDGLKLSQRQVKKPMAELTLDMNVEFRNDTNGTDSDHQLSPFKSIVDRLFKTLVNTVDKVLEENDVDDNNTSKGSSLMSDMFGLGGVQMIDCKCPEAGVGKHKDDCPMSDKQTASTTTENSKEGADEVLPQNGFQVMEQMARDSMKLFGSVTAMDEPHQDIDQLPVAIEQIIKEEIRVKNEAYEWYDYLLIVLIVGTSVLLLVTAVTICLKRGKRSKNVDLYKTSDSVKNDNYTANGIEKIKTIFINMKQ